MTRCASLARTTIATLTASLISIVASAHSASDAYLSLVVQSGSSSATTKTVVHGQRDIALRDLDFVLKLADNGDGNITWGELREHQDAIARYAFARIGAAVDGLR